MCSLSLVGHPYTKGQAFFLATSNIHPIYRDKFLEEKLRLENLHNHFPLELEFSQLSGTMEEWANNFGLYIPGKTSTKPTSIVTNIDQDGYSDAEPEEVFALNEKKQSFLDCGMPGHVPVNCDVNINYFLTYLKMKAQPALAKKIIQK